MNLNFKNHFTLMAGYNQRLNYQVYTAAGLLTQAQLKQDCGAFFGSVFATLNHVLVGDLLWLTRFRNHPSGFNCLKMTDKFPEFTSLNQIAYSEFDELCNARKKLDKIICSWIQSDISETDFSENIEYVDTKGNPYRRNFGELLAHFFNHQTHHRGQVTTLLAQFGHDNGVTDFLIDIPLE